MANHQKHIIIPILIISCIPILAGVYQSHSSKNSVYPSMYSNPRALRTMRQLLRNPQLFLPTIPVENMKLNVPIPVNIGFYPGGYNNNKMDPCDRDEVMMEGGYTCQQILGENDVCKTEEEILVDPNTYKGYCAPRLCPPDRIFVPLTQLCHDPADTDLCPPGRRLYYSSYGSAVCSCPDGTMESDDDLDDDVCEPILSKSLQCPYGESSESSEEEVKINSKNEKEVFWFKDAYSPPQCVPDPCSGFNLKRAPNTLPFIPSKTGKCYLLGQSEGVCSPGFFYSLVIDELRGECQSLEDAGYSIFDPDELDLLMKMFGPNTITTNETPPVPTSSTNMKQSSYGTNNHQNLNIQDNLVSSQKPFQGTQSYQNRIDTQPINVVTQSSHAQSNLPTHHFITIGPNKTTHSTRIAIQSSGSYSKISYNNQQSNQNSFRPQSTHGSNNQQTNQDSFSPQSTHGSYSQQSNPQSFQQQGSQGPNSSIAQPIPFPSHTNAHQNNQQPVNSNKPQQICSFIQTGIGSLGGHKVCTDTHQTGLGDTSQIHSMEVTGQEGQNFNSPEIFGNPSSLLSFEPINREVRDSYGYRFARSLGFKNPLHGILTLKIRSQDKGYDTSSLFRRHRDVKSKSKDFRKTIKYNTVSEDLGFKKILSRKKRRAAALPYASPSNVYESKLLPCKQGERRDMNRKCKHISLPSQVPKQRGIRAAPSTSPSLTCPQGMAYNIRRSCVPSRTAATSLTALRLG